MAFSESQNAQLEAAEQAIQHGNYRKILSLDPSLLEEVNTRNLERLRKLQEEITEMQRRLSEQNRVAQATKATTSQQPVARPLDPLNPASNPTSPLAKQQVQLSNPDTKLLKEAGMAIEGQRLLNVVTGLPPKLLRVANQSPEMRKQMLGAAAVAKTQTQQPTQMPGAAEVRMQTEHVVETQYHQRASEPAKPESQTLQEASTKTPRPEPTLESVAKTLQEATNEVNKLIQELPANVSVQEARMQEDVLERQKQEESYQQLQQMFELKPTLSQNLQSHDGQEEEEKKARQEADKEDKKNREHEEELRDEKEDSLDADTGTGAPQEDLDTKFGKEVLKTSIEGGVEKAFPGAGLVARFIGDMVEKLADALKGGEGPKSQHGQHHHFMPTPKPPRGH